MSPPKIYKFSKISVRELGKTTLKQTKATQYEGGERQFPMPLKVFLNTQKNFFY